jgi:polysaccharide biosynthesis/export protein
MKKYVSVLTVSVSGYFRNFIGVFGAHGMWNLLALILLCIASGGCNPTTPNYSIPASVSSAAPTSVLAVGDVIRLTYPGAPEFNQSIKIQADGKVGLPQIGNVTASGRTSSSLQSALTAMYRPHLNDPTVFVSLEQPAASVYVSGEVRSPGKVPLDRSITALEAVMEVGGFSPMANARKVYVIRNEGGRQRRYALNLASTLSGHESKAFYLRPYDVVYVERSNW